MQAGRQWSSTSRGRAFRRVSWSCTGDMSRQRPFRAWPMRDATILIGNSTAGTVTGLSITFDALLAEFRRRSLPHSLVDRNSTETAEPAGRFGVVRAMRNAGLLVRYYRS